MTKAFDNSNYAWKADIDYRKHPELYRVGKGEQGVLLCEPYKSEILPYWRFRTAAIAKLSSEKIYSLFEKYMQEKDFIGADMARKFLQMGFTRSRRYANFKGGKKYAHGKRETLPKGTGDTEKIKCAKIFYDKWRAAEKNETYANLKQSWKQKYG